jgi:FkbM family methyltransferase
MSLLKKLRSNETINFRIRRGIQLLNRFSELLASRWRVAGTAVLSINDLLFKMYAKCDDGIVDALYYNRSYIETYDLVVFSKLTKAKSTILDIGANTGVYSLLSASKSSEIEVFSFEPNSINMKRLEKNIALNEFTNITPIPMAVGSVNQVIKFTVPKNDIISDTSSAKESFSQSTYSNTIDWQNIEVDQTTIDDFCLTRRIRNVNLMKIDVEGYEIEVLKGAEQIIRSCKPIILLETFLPHSERKYIQDLIDSCDYYIYTLFKSGIVRIPSINDSNPGLNYLLWERKTPQIFTPIEDLVAFSELTT